MNVKMPPWMGFDIHVRIDLWGASLRWVESISVGLDARGASNVVSHVCPAYVGVTFHCEPEELPALAAYAERVSRLALSSPGAKRALAAERAWAAKVAA